ncbi:hypothetical protein SRM1_00541 [Pseudomonas fluorescens]|nr:hypothetical protein SRM1_00541 [Pseudomonas fluorescens]
MIDPADRDHFHAPQYSSLQRLGDFIVIEQQAEIGAALDEFACDFALSSAGELYFQAGKLIGQRAETFHQRLIGHRLILRHAQLRFLAAHHRHGPAIQALTLAQDFSRLLEQRLPRFGEPRLTTAATLKQAHAQIVLEHGDGTADRRLRLALLPGHGGERTLFGDRDKHA